jgi:hypothetical protein
MFIREKIVWSQNSKNRYSALYLCWKVKEGEKWINKEAYIGMEKDYNDTSKLIEVLSTLKVKDPKGKTLELLLTYMNGRKKRHERLVKAGKVGFKAI